MYIIPKTRDLFNVHVQEEDTQRVGSGHADGCYGAVLSKRPLSRRVMEPSNKERHAVFWIKAFKTKKAMRLAVITCEKYSDAHPAFLRLLNIHWPAHPPVWLVTDQIPPSEIEKQCDGVYVFPQTGIESWCPRLAAFANICGDDDICLAQEDFLLNEPVKVELVQHALEQMQIRGAGCVRLYPCPGANEDYGDSKVGLVKPHTAYRASLQLSIFNPHYLKAIASQCKTPSDFEINGSAYASTNLKEHVLAWKRESLPWPVDYLCSGIGRGLWSQDAKRLCEKHGIVLESKRGFQPA